MAANSAPARVRRALLMCTPLLVFTACTHMPEVKEHEVVGTWTFSADESAKGMPGPAAEVELRADHTLAIKDFPLDSGYREMLSERPVTSEGSWEFLQNLEDGHPKYDKQSGVDLTFTNPDSQPGVKTGRILPVEKDDDGTVRLVIYVGFPDIAEDKYILTKND
ncbi:UNVERIFIED_CONTAM: hypothetical protein ABIE34_000607 [Jeotgalibacillus campisalis]